MMTVFLLLNGSLFSSPVLVYPLRLSLDLLNSVHATLFITTHLGIICRRAKLNSTSQVHDFVVYKMRVYSVPWVIGLSLGSTPDHGFHDDTF